ncbi:MAG: flagellar filament capping protein FliD, partial [bacterium]|nr:flagellar filament capping protein FliD [bacterium]
MAESTFQIGGIMSGLDTNGLVDAYMAINRRPQDKMVEEHTIATYRQELLQTANAKLLMLQGTASALAQESTFGTYNVYSTLPSVATATAGAGAVEGAYELYVQQLAKASKVQSNYFVRGQDSVSSGGGITLGSAWSSAGFSGTVDPSRNVTVRMEDGRSASFSLSQAARRTQYLSSGAVSSGAGITLGSTWDSAGFAQGPDASGAVTITTTGGVSRTFDLDTMQRTYGTTSYQSASGVSSTGHLDVTKKWDQAGFAVLPTDGGNVTITMANGDSETFNVDNKDKVEDFIARVNSSDIVEVTMSYDYNADTFLINSDSGERFTITEDGTTGFFTAANIDTTSPVEESGYETVQGFIDAVNADTALGVNLSYDAVADSFTMTSQKGEGLILSESGTVGFFQAAGIDVTDQYTSASQTVQAFLDAVNTSQDVSVKIEYDSVTDNFSAYSLDGQMFTLEENGSGGFLDAAGLKATLTSQDEVAEGAATLDLAQSFAAAGFAAEPTGLMSINGITFDLGAFATVQDFMDAVNTHSMLDVTLSYDNVIDRFQLQSNKAGESLDLEEDDGGFFTQAKISTEDVWHTDPTKKLQDAHFREDIQDGSEFRINGVTFVVSSGVDTINSIIQEINQSDVGVTAFFDRERNALSLTSADTGNKSISLTEVSGNFLSAVMLADSGSSDVGVVEMGQDAKFRLNGAELTATSNIYKFNGLTFNLNGEGTTVINADLNVDYAVSSVRSFISTYNETISYLKEK